MNFQLKTAATAMAIAVALLILIFWRGEGEAGKIKSRLDDLLALVEKDGAERRLPALTKAKKISGFFFQDCEVQLIAGDPSIKGRETLMGPVFKLRSDMDKISISLRDRSVEVGSAEDTASMTLRARARLQFHGDDVRDEQRFVIDWVNIDGQWLIARVIVPEG